ncbi:MAG: histidine phosphatase family protein [Bacteroidales bacterium]|nr:histidine phosphatase family protein [Bacteroidales bacterium]
MKLIIVRHGETIENLQGICQGQLDGTLSPKGLLQVKLTADRLQNEKVDTIFSSDLKRAVDSAKEIHKYYSTKSLIIDKRLRERYFGSFQGEKFPENKRGLALAEDAESNEELYLRVLDFYEDIISKHIDYTILIVSHGVAIRMLITVIQKLSPSNINSIDELKNGSVTIIEIINGTSPKITLYNSTSHLE